MKLDAVKEALSQGNEAIVATDTVYGFIALPGSVGHEHIYTLKKRPKDQALPCFISNIDALSEYATSVPDYAYRLGEMFWPGPLTLVLHASDKTCKLGAAAQDKTIALRCPNDESLLELLSIFDGLLVSTSANIHGQDAVTKANELPSELLNVAGAQDLPESCEGQIASTIVDCTGEYPKILRNGPIPEQVILDVACFGARLGSHK